MAGKGAAIGWKVVGLGAAIGAGILARKALTSGWRLAVGDTPPANPADPDTTLPEAIAWAVASGAVVGVARMFAARSAADYWRRSTGHLPPGVESVT